MDKPRPESSSGPELDADMEWVQMKDGAGRWAEENGYELSSAADTVIDGLIKRKKMYGKQYCPCRALRDGDGAWNDSIVCPCAQVHDDIARKGRCHCNLFVKKIKTSL